MFAGKPDNSGNIPVITQIKSDESPLLIQIASGTMRSVFLRAHTHSTAGPALSATSKLPSVTHSYRQGQLPGWLAG